MPNACAITTLAVLWPTPGNFSSASRSAGTAPSWSAKSSSLKRCMAFDFCGDKPQGRMIDLISSTLSWIICSGQSALANNAGVTWSEDIDRFTEKAWDKVVDLDGKSPFFLTQKLLPLLDKASSQEARSVVINVSSVNAIRPSGLRNYSYAFAKAGLQQLSVQMAQDLNHRNINVNVIAPGPFKSKMTAPLYANEEVEAEVMKSFTMGRWGQTEDAAGLAIFLSSSAGSFLTGLIVPCDGGATAIG